MSKSLILLVFYSHIPSVSNRLFSYIATARVLGVHRCVVYVEAADNQMYCHMDKEGPATLTAFTKFYFNYHPAKYCFTIYIFLFIFVLC